MIFDILIQMSVISGQPYLAGLFMDWQRVACAFDPGWLTCQVFPVG